MTMTKLPSLARVLAFVSLAALTAGCKSITASAEDPQGVRMADYRLRHPIAVREGARTLDILVGDNRGGLSPDQRAEVAALAGVWRREATGGIVIEVPAGTANTRAAHGVVREVRGVLVAAGVPAHGIIVRPYTPSEPVRLATVRVKYPKMVAETGPCGLWPDDVGPTYDPVYNSNRPYWNHGCASQRNLAAQVANPADLIQPRSEGPIYAARRSTVLEKYRKGESTATVNPDANKGKISDVGQ
jgi:pilus assembly protein CpaD